MNAFSAKNVALATVLAMGTLSSGSASAAVLHTADGGVAVTKEGVPVLVRGAPEFCENDQVSDLMQAEGDRVVFFDFNKIDLTKHAKKQLHHLAIKLKHEHAKSVTVTGYADTMGNVAYNEKLALRRAKAVRDFLVASGVKGVEVRSLGKSETKSKCADLPRAKKIACGAVDRRVEIEVK